MKKLLLEQFGCSVQSIKKVSGYDNLNYLVVGKGFKYIFKTYAYEESLLAILNAENDILLQLQQNDAFPKPIPFINNEYVKVLDIEGKPMICRMLSFLEGTFVGSIKLTEEVADSLGSFLASLDLKLSKLNNHIIKARKWEWDIQYLPLNKKYLNAIKDSSNRNIVKYFIKQFEENVWSELPNLRHQIIHNDANEWNILTDGNHITGLIDFGDLAYSLLVNELAVAITYICYDKEDPLYWAKIVLKAYHKTLPLEEKEIQLLYYLVASRLCISVCNSAHAREINPDNHYATSSEENAWYLLKKWLTINPIHAEHEFREATGYQVPNIENIVEKIKKRHRYINPIVSLSYEKPIYMAKAAFQYMYDAYGTTFLDAYNNIPHVGHSHPKVVEAAQRQLAQLNTNTRYHYDLLTQYSERLLSKFPASLSNVFFVNSGSAATDLALRLAHTHTQCKRIMVMEYGYHGNTQLAMDISDYKFSNKKGQGQKEHILKATVPDTYKGKYRNNDGSAGKQYAKDVLTDIKNSEQSVAAFITEPIVGCGGQVPLAKGYLKEIYPVIRKLGGVCISDEVQTGFGRLGTSFWGYEAQEVIPDIVILGKPMGNGHPIGAVICTKEIATSFGKGVEFFSSFGGNPVSCAIGLSVLNIIEEEGLQKKAKEVGNYYMSLLKDLQKEYVQIGDVRGSGLFIGVELIKNNESEPNTELAQVIKNELRHRNILISTDGPHDNVLKTKPPLCFTKENAEQVVTTIHKIFKQHI